MKKFALLASCLLFTTLLQTSTSFAEQAVYIHDVIYVPLRASPGPRNRIVKNKKGRQVLIKSGTKLEVIGSKDVDGFKNVRTNKGYKGWIHEQYLVNQPIAKDQLQSALLKADNASKKSAMLKKTIAELKASFSTSENNLNTKNSSLDQRVATLAVKNKELNSELKRITAISKNAIKMDNQFRELSENNEKLKFDIDVLKNEKNQLQSSDNKDWFMIGAGAVGFGAILVFSAPWFKRRKRPDDYW